MREENENGGSSFSVPQHVSPFAKFTFLSQFYSLPIPLARTVLLPHIALLLSPFCVHSVTLHSTMFILHKFLDYFLVFHPCIYGSYYETIRCLFSVHLNWVFWMLFQFYQGCFHDSSGNFSKSFTSSKENNEDVIHNFSFLITDRTTT